MGAHYSAWSPCACSRMSSSLTSPSPRRPPLYAEKHVIKVPSKALTQSNLPLRLQRLHFRHDAAF